MLRLELMLASRYFINIISRIQEAEHGGMQRVEKQSFKTAVYMANLGPVIYLLLSDNDTSGAHAGANAH